MPTMVINGLCGAGGGLVRSISGWFLTDDREKFSWKRLGGSIMSGFIGGIKMPEPISAATMGWVASEAFHKLRRKMQTKKLPENS